MSFYYGDENNPEVNLAKKVFETFAGSSSGLNQEQFRRIFYATGEDLADNDINELFGEVDDDRDGTISLEEFTKWFRKDDSYEYNIRTKPLRDVKERLKVPAFLNAIRYLMQRNNGGSGLDSNGKILDVNLKLKVGNMDHQGPALGIDIRHETYSYDGANPAIIAEFIWDESRDVISAEDNMRKVAQNYVENHHAPTFFEPLQVDGKPGGRMTFELSNDVRDPLQMITSFMSNLEEFHLWAHASQGLDELQGTNLCLDAGLVFKGNRAFFNMLPLEAAVQMGVKSGVYEMAKLLDHVHLNVAVDRLAELGEQLVPPQQVIQDLKAEMARKINYGALSADFHPFYPMGVKTLKTLKVKAFGHSFVMTGINLDVSFLFNHAFNQEEHDKYFRNRKDLAMYDDERYHRYNNEMPEGHYNDVAEIIQLQPDVLYETPDIEQDFPSKE